VRRPGPLDTRRRVDGISELVVSAREIRGNRATTRSTFLIYNRPGSPPGAPDG
jgi:hypothetical protein